LETRTLQSIFWNANNLKNRAATLFFALILPLSLLFVGFEYTQKEGENALNREEIILSFCLKFWYSFSICFYPYMFLIFREWKTKRFDYLQSVHHITYPIHVLYFDDPNDDQTTNLCRKAAEKVSQRITEVGIRPNTLTFVKPISAHDPNSILDQASVLWVFLPFGRTNPSIASIPYSGSSATTSPVSTPQLPDRLTDWLREECALRRREGRDAGPRKNIVYTLEGQRRCCFVRSKFAIVEIEPEESESQRKKEKNTSVPSVGEAMDGYLSEFGSYRLLPLQKLTSTSVSHETSWMDSIIEETLNLILLDKSYHYLPSSSSSSYPLRTKIEQHKRDRGQIRESFLPLPNFLSWLESCPECGQRLFYERLRVRFSDFRLRPQDYWVWFFLTSTGKKQLFKFYKPQLEGFCVYLLGPLANAPFFDLIASCFLGFFVIYSTSLSSPFSSLASLTLVTRSSINILSFCAIYAYFKLKETNRQIQLASISAASSSASSSSPTSGELLSSPGVVSSSHPPVDEHKAHSGLVTRFALKKQYYTPPKDINGIHSVSFRNELTALSKPVSSSTDFNWKLFSSESTSLLLVNKCFEYHEKFPSLPGKRNFSFQLFSRSSSILL
jgi:hypothetical protein